jgi:hypothetical protein
MIHRILCQYLISVIYVQIRVFCFYCILLQHSYCLLLHLIVLFFDGTDIFIWTLKLHFYGIKFIILKQISF